MEKENKEIIKLIKETVKELLFREKTFRITEVKHFHREGKTLPNGHGIQRGGFFKECKDNNNKFKINNNQYLINETYNIIEGIHSEQYGLYNYRGGIIIFSTDINSLVLTDNKLLNWLLQKGKTFLQRLFSKSKLNNIINRFNSNNEKVLGSDKIEDYIGAFSIGNFFSGRYVDDNNNIYNEKSLSLEVNGISSSGLIYLAEEIARDFIQETVLVKDLNNNKIFLVNQEIGDNYELSDLNRKV